MMDFAGAMAFVEGFSHSGKPVRDLSRIASLLEQLGNPQDHLQFIHIAGTNGKGSVAEYLTNALIRCGYRTGTFTSPFILRYTDRIRLNGRDIPGEALCRICERVSQVASPDDGLSQFEITFAIAMLWFVQEHAEIIVLETGMGGLLDCTNIIAPPLCTVITSVSYDHMAILGNTIEEIAAQKAGILKKGSPAVFAADSLPGAMQVLKDRAASLEIPFRIADPYQPSCIIRETDGLYGNRFEWHGLLFSTRMGGIHQIYNAITALEALDSLPLEINWEQVQKGISETQVPARIQILHRNPLIVLDGGHNAGGIRALADVLEESGIRSWCGICGMTHADAVDTAGEVLSPYLDHVICVDGFIPNAVPARQLSKVFTCPAEVSSPPKALFLAREWAAGHHGAVVICGSLYLASFYLQEV